MTGTTHELPVFSMNPIKSLLVSALLLAVGLSAAHASDADRLQLARDVIKATQADKMLDAMTGQLQQMVADQMKASGSNLPPDKLAQLQAAQKEVVAISIESAKAMMTKLDQVYADVYSEEELLAIKAFFESKAGRSMMDKQSALMQRMMPLINQMQQDMMPKVQEVMKRHMPAPQAGN